MSEQIYSETPSGDLFSTQPVVYGTFWERVGAYFIDAIILTVPLVLIVFVVGPQIALVFYIGVWLYFTLMESSERQATIGKKAMGLKVTDVNGNRISFGQANGRFFGKILSGLILYIGYLMVLWDVQRQGLHDKLAGTLVVKQQA